MRRYPRCEDDVFEDEEYTLSFLVSTNTHTNQPSGSSLEIDFGAPTTVRHPDTRSHNSFPILILSDWVSRVSRRVDEHVIGLACRFVATSGFYMFTNHLCRIHRL